MTVALRTGLLLLVVGWAGPAVAAPVVYSFNAPTFPANATTPFVNVAPDVGPVGFLAGFTSSPDAAGFTITTFPPPQPFITGQALVDPTGGAIDVLTVTTNMPIDSVQLGFAILSSGTLVLTTPAGTVSQPSGNVGGNFPGGTLMFASGVGFTTFQLEAFDANGVRTRFAIDNLTLNTAPAATVPEPSAVVLFGMMVIGIGGRMWRGSRTISS